MSTEHIEAQRAPNRPPPGARPVLAADHVGLIYALAASAQLRRLVVARTQVMREGSTLPFDGSTLTVGPVLGHGMVGVTYAVDHDGRALALKRARAPFGLFREMLRAERATTRLASEALPVAEIVGFDDHTLLKRRCDGPTLQRLLVEGTHREEHRVALRSVLAAALSLLDRHDVHVEPSPKNLAWENGRFVLLDAGEPLLRQDANEAMWREGSFERYVEHYAPALKTAGSEPSALHVDRPEPDLGRAERWSFLREWDVWIPHLPGALPRQLLATVDPSALADEILYEMRRERGRWALSATPFAAADPGSRRRALTAWRERARAAQK